MRKSNGLSHTSCAGLFCARQYCAIGRRANDRHSLGEVESQGLSLQRAATRRDGEQAKKDSDAAIRLFFGGIPAQGLHSKVLFMNTMLRSGYGEGGRGYAYLHTVRRGADLAPWSVHAVRILSTRAAAACIWNLATGG